jgi:hypothetical protein
MVHFKNLKIHWIGRKRTYERRVKENRCLCLEVKYFLEDCHTEA